MRNIAQVGSDCCGCGACAQACRAGAIRFEQDAEGFYAAVVDEAMCVGCAVCVKVCPQINAVAGNEPKLVAAAYSKSDGILNRSSSGGLFSAMGKAALEGGATVYGAALDEESWTVGIVSAADEASMEKLCGSKYVQCLPFAGFNDIKKTLADGGKVFFTGCPCQVAALKSFVGKDALANLTTVDIICHGTPSPLAFQNYIKWLGKKENAPISRYRFRTKERGWGKTISYRSGARNVYKPSILDRYNYNFMYCNDYRECCYKCCYASSVRQGDITLGDYWGILREHAEFYNDRGVSLVLVNTDKGKALFEKIKPDISFINSTFEKASRHNVNLKSPTPRPKARDGFYEGIISDDACAYVEKRMRAEPSLKSLVKEFIAWLAKRSTVLFSRIRRAL